MNEDDLTVLCPTCKKEEAPYEVSYKPHLKAIHAKYECACGCNRSWTNVFNMGTEVISREGRV